MINSHCFLLPHEKELLYGVKPEDCQITPWALKEFNIKKHWSCSRGEGIKVAVIDTGCDLDHIDIKSNLLEGYDFVNKHKYPDDDNGHGTHVAGTIAACDNSLGMVGIAPEAKIIPIKCLDKDGGGSTRLISDGIDFAIKAGADIITMSLGSKGASLDILRSVRRANKAGVIMCCAAGNSGNSHDLLFPANFDETISIGSISRRLKVSRFSCCGDLLDFLAPGEDILSATPGNTYSKMNGTSMAAPFATGCMALYMSKNKGKYTREDIVNTFKAHAIEMNDERYKGRKEYEGNGIINPVPC